METHEKYVHELNVFKDTICKECGLCDKVVTPSFCSLIYDSNSKLFAKQIVSTIMLSKLTKNGLQALRCFDGFRTIFCNGCIILEKAENCDIETQLNCYSFFLNQSGRTLDDNARSLILRGNDNKKKSIQASLALNNFSKKDKKTIKKFVKGVMLSFKSGHVSVTNQKKPVSTTCFWNKDDVEWGEMIKEYLSI